MKTVAQRPRVKRMMQAMIEAKDSTADAILKDVLKQEESRPQATMENCGDEELSHVLCYYQLKLLRRYSSFLKWILATGKESRLAHR